MKTHPNISIPTKSALRRRFVGQGFAAIFATALTLGLSVESVMAQGGYYSNQVSVNGGAPFIPSGLPVTSTANLNAINSALTGTASLIIPLPPGKTTATAAQYAAAVQAVTTAVASGSGPAGVTISSLASELALYRSQGVPQNGAALEAMAKGVIASTSAAKPADLTAIATAAATTYPNGIGSPDYTPFINTIANDDTQVAGLGNVVSAILVGAVSTSFGASAVQPAMLNTLLKSAMDAVTTANPSNPATSSAALRQAINEGVASSAIAAIVASPVLNRPVNLDLATSGVTIPSASLDLGSMLAAVTTAAGGPSDSVSGAIAQGALRNPINRNSTSYAVIKAGVGGGTYSNNLVDAFHSFNTGSAANAAAIAAARGQTAAAAAGALRFPANANTIIRDSLTGNVSASSATRQATIERGVAAAQTSALTVATTLAAGAFGGATLTDVTTGVIRGAQISSAGGIAKNVITAAGLTPANATTVGTIAIRAAVGVAAAGNVNDAFADIGYNLANALRGTPAAADARSGAAVTAMINEVGAGGATYIPAVAARAGNLGSNTAAITAAAVAADTAVNAGANVSAINKGITLVGTLSTLTYNLPAAYNAQLTAYTLPNTDPEVMALLYASSLGYSADAVGGLAAAINKTNTSPTALLQAAISANRSKRAGLTVAAEVVSYIKTNTIAGTNLQAYIGKTIIDNSTLVVDIATAATVAAPQFVNYAAHAVAFNAPQQAYLAAASVVGHSEISTRVTGDRPGAIAAITSGFTQGILESTNLSAANTTNALRDAVREVTKAVVSATYNAQGAANFKQGTGVTSTSFTLVKAKGVAGGVTGFVAQMVKPGDTTISTDITTALSAIQAAVGSGGFGNDIVQAAAQAYGWVSGQVTNAGVINAIANAVNTGYLPSAAQLAKYVNVATFGMAQANGGGVGAVPGAGASGLRDLVTNPGAPYYDNHSASGLPVSNIFTL
jgi:hypothetical protein